MQERWLQFLTKPVGLVSGQGLKPFKYSQVLVCGRAVVIKLCNAYCIHYINLKCSAAFEHTISIGVCVFQLISSVENNRKQAVMAKMARQKI